MKRMIWQGNYKGSFRRRLSTSTSLGIRISRLRSCPRLSSLECLKNPLKIVNFLRLPKQTLNSNLARFLVSPTFIWWWARTKRNCFTRCPKKTVNWKRLWRCCKGSYSTSCSWSMISTRRDLKQSLGSISSRRLKSRSHTKFNLSAMNCLIRHLMRMVKN